MIGTIIVVEVAREAKPTVFATAGTTSKPCVPAFDMQSARDHQIDCADEDAENSHRDPAAA